MKILVIGGMGFVGSHLSEEFVNTGHSVVIASRSKKKIRNIANIIDHVKIEYGDITNYKWLETIILKHKPDVIFHLAGQLTHYEAFENPLYDVDVNSKTTLVILETLRKMEKPCRLILGSTFWVVGKPKTLPINEETPCNPLNLYAADRLASEHYCRIYNRVYGLDALVMRLTNTFGPREQYNNPRKAALNYLLYKGFKGETVPIYDEGKFFRDYIYISDIVSAAKAIMEKGKSGEIYFVGTNTPTWFYDIGKWIEELTPGKVVYVESPEYHKKIDVGNIVVDNTKLKQLGWNWKVPVKEGLKKTLEYYQRLEKSEPI
ncbi:MAG TPA: NAD-dependent epimerase/dehydratase family protein [Candidatus Bathyarchaeota archaeon]|nr:NAD-dependent epimerase/dehydratase family protein [Candidatus Bathyarchaeota archaeon]